MKDDRRLSSSIDRLSGWRDVRALAMRPIDVAMVAKSEIGECVVLQPGDDQGE